MTELAQPMPRCEAGPLPRARPVWYLAARSTRAGERLLTADDAEDGAGRGPVRLPRPCLRGPLGRAHHRRQGHGRLRRPLSLRAVTGRPCSTTSRRFAAGRRGRPHRLRGHHRLPTSAERWAHDARPRRVRRSRSATSSRASGSPAPTTSTAATVHASPPRRWTSTPSSGRGTSRARLRRAGGRDHGRAGAGRRLARAGPRGPARRGAGAQRRRTSPLPARGASSAPTQHCGQGLQSAQHGVPDRARARRRRTCSTAGARSPTHPSGRVAPHPRVPAAAGPRHRRQRARRRRDVGRARRADQGRATCSSCRRTTCSPPPRSCARWPRSRPGHPVTRSFSAAYWRGGDERVEGMLFRPQFFDKLVAWGGERTIRSAQKYVGPGFELVAFDPKTSISLIGREAFESDAALADVAERAAADATLMNQQACASSRFQFVEGSDRRRSTATARCCSERLGVERPTASVGRSPAARRSCARRSTACAAWSRLLPGLGRLRGHGRGDPLRRAGGLPPRRPDRQRRPGRRPGRGGRLAPTWRPRPSVSTRPRARPSCATRWRPPACSAWSTSARPVACETGLPHDGFYPLQRFVRWVNDEG